MTGNDLTFYVKHGEAIERIAIVGDEKWRTESLMFAGCGPAESSRRVLLPGEGRRGARLAVNLKRASR